MVFPVSLCQLPGSVLYFSFAVLIVDHNWQRPKLAGTDKGWGVGGNGIWTLKPQVYWEKKKKHKKITAYIWNFPTNDVRMW